MPMPPRYTVDQLLDHALALFHDGGLDAVTIAGVARQAGAPSGSIYHRFASRDALVASLWLRTVERFQEAYLAALAGDDPVRAAHDAVDHVLRWVRANPAEAALLVRHGPDDVLADVDGELARHGEQLQRRLERAMGAWRQRHPARLSTARARFALVDLPYGAMRPYLQAGRPAPDELDVIVHQAMATAITAIAESDQ